MVDFGQELRAIRRELGLTQAALGERAGYRDATFIAHLESGRKKAGEDVVDRLIRALRDIADESQLRRLLRAAGRPEELPTDPVARLAQVLTSPLLAEENRRTGEALLAPLLALLESGPLHPEVGAALRETADGLFRLAQLAIAARGVA